MLCFTLQRYKIESNSQRSVPSFKTTRGCVSHCKDTKLKAIHNQYNIGFVGLFVVFHTAKIQNWKQFTTCYPYRIAINTLCFTLQRYKIESNSQQKLSEFNFCECCVSHCKDTKLKAIHNCCRRIIRILRCVSHCKDTKLKAIHNLQPYTYKRGVVVFHTAKIQNWKQFTTNAVWLISGRMLCFTLQRYKIESNSQQNSRKSNKSTGCVSHCKDTKLKAIHNHVFNVLLVRYVVFHTAKIQNWKQFTTKLSTFFCYLELCFTLQRYKIESNSQL